MSFGSQIAEGLSPLVDLVYPPRCPICGDGVGRQGGLCIACWSELVIPGEPCCARCSRPFAPGAQEEQVCAPCLSDPPRHDGVFAATLYNEPSRKLVLAFKHGGKIGHAPLLARLIAARLPEPTEDTPLLVPVPLHRWRLWKRGYNQAGLLARELEKLGKGAFVPDALVRKKATPSLGGLGRKARERALSGAIEVAARHRSRVKGKNIVLVDDVLTSGTTANACVSALLKSGARSVKIACFARVMEEALEVARMQDSLKSETPEVAKTSGAT